MNHMFKLLFLILALPCYIAIGGMAKSMDFSQRPILNQQISVHDVFKDMTEEQIFKAMEDAQELMKAMESASPEEQMAFARMMEETFQNFSEDDLAEIEKIAKVVEPLMAEKEAATKTEPATEEPVKEIKKEVVVSGDSSLEYMLHKINKTINSILLKAKSDRSLTEMLTAWPKKDDFNELVRLLQALNKKELILKLTTTKTDDIKKLLETIENFGKRLEVENKQFTVADTFGLEVDEKTSAENALKFTKILEFFSGATETLLPMIVKFIQEFEPEALKIAKANDDQAKNSLDAAKQIEKMKRPVDQFARQDRFPSNGSYNQHAGYTPSGSNYQGNDSSAQSRRDRNRMNADTAAAKSQNPTAAQAAKQADKSQKSEADKQAEKAAADKKEKAATSFKAVIDKIEKYDDMFDNNAFTDYTKALTQASKIYGSFDANPVTKDTPETAAMGPMTKEQGLKKQAEMTGQFKKNIAAAHTHYAAIKDIIEKIKPQINDIKEIAVATRASLSTLSLQDLEKLSVSPALKTLKSRFQSYEGTFNNIQKELKDKHEKHMLETAEDKDIAAYNELKSKSENLHGLDRTIIETKNAMELLDRAIKGEIKRAKREANKR